MTPENNNSITENKYNSYTDRHLLEAINQKVDYLIELLKEESLRFPYHQTFMDTYQNQKPD